MASSTISSASSVSVTLLPPQLSPEDAFDLNNSSPSLPRCSSSWPLLPSSFSTAPISPSLVSCGAKFPRCPPSSPAFPSSPPSPSPSPSPSSIPSWRSRGINLAITIPLPGELLEEETEGEQEEGEEERENEELNKGGVDVTIASRILSSNASNPSSDPSHLAGSPTTSRMGSPTTLTAVNHKTTPTTVKSGSPTTARAGSPTTLIAGSPTTARVGSPTTAKPSSGSPTTARPSSLTTTRQREHSGSPTTARAGSPTTAAPEESSSNPSTHRNLSAMMQLSPSSGTFPRSEPTAGNNNPCGSAEPWRCCICLEEYAGYLRNVSCGHGHTFCVGCTSKYFEQCVHDNKRFRCPASFICEQEFSHAVVMSFLSPMVSSSKAVNTNLADVKPGDWVFRCENPLCPGVIRVDNIDALPGPVSCELCNQVFVLAKSDLKQFKKIHNKKDLTLEEKLDEFFLTRKTRSCPYCHKMIERSEGCPHMSCVCGNSFCWNCGGKYKTSHELLLGGHYSKWNINGCPHLLFPNHKRACKFTRGALFTAKVASALTFGPPVAAASLVVVGIPYGVFKGCQKIHQSRNRKK